MKVVKRPVETVFAQNIELNQSLIFVYVRKRSKTLVILFTLKAFRGLNLLSKTSVLISLMSVATKHPLSNWRPKIWKQACSSIGKRLNLAIKYQENRNCDKLWFLHETLVRIGVTREKIPCCSMCDWACRSDIIKSAKIFLSHAKHY